MATVHSRSSRCLTRRSSRPSTASSPLTWITTVTPIFSSPATSTASNRRSAGWRRATVSSCAATERGISRRSTRRGAASSFPANPATSLAFIHHAAISSSLPATTTGRCSFGSTRERRERWLLLRPGLLRFNDDHAVRTTASIHREVGRVLQDLDRLDVVRAEPTQAAARARRYRYAVDHVQWLIAAEERALTADLHGEAAVGGPRHCNAGDAALKYLLDRIAGSGIDFPRREGGGLWRRRRSRRCRRSSAAVRAADHQDGD